MERLHSSHSLHQRSHLQRRKPNYWAPSTQVDTVGVIKFLLENGADVNQTDKVSMTGALPRSPFRVVAGTT